MHTIVGAGAAEGAMDAGNMLKPMLARGELHCIGATTLDEYRKHIEKDAALERRFQPVVVDEPTVEDTISILRGLRERFEVHHGVKIQDTALVAAATLSHRYITDRFLPDKAIDLVDEACAVIRTEIDSMPAELDAITRRVMQLEIEEAALTNESDPASKERLEVLRKELAELRSQADAMTAQWESERQAIKKLQGLRSEIEQLRHEIEEAERSYDLNRAAELRHGRLPELERRLAGEEERLLSKQGGERLLREEVTADEIAQVVGRWTGIPVSRLVEGERQKLLRLDEVLHERVIGQDEAVQLVADAVIRARAGIKDPRRPIGSFIFLGPTGVGKTELSKALAEALFDSEDNIVRLDMSEYQERHTVSRLMGAPPGYVGYEEGGQLTEQVRRKPYSVVLFDEVEKAHPDVFNTLLQLLDDGRLTDAQGRTVDFRNTVVIMTSNIGSPLMSSARPSRALSKAPHRRRWPTLPARPASRRSSSARVAWAASSPHWEACRTRCCTRPTARSSSCPAVRLTPRGAAGRRVPAPSSLATTALRRLRLRSSARHPTPARTGAWSPCTRTPPRRTGSARPTTTVCWLLTRSTVAGCWTRSQAAICRSSLRPPCWRVHPHAR
jgi:ATP-dependent Clp protease ATP-binding subunit ClpB